MIKPPKNPNYAATVVVIRQIVPLENCDNVVAAPLLGYQAIVSKTTQVGDIGLLFTAETQLSEEYARMNNLHRHADLNDNPDAKGYLEDNRRVKALKFRGHRSDALFMPLSSLRYCAPSGTVLSEGDTFDELDGHEICRKYVRPGNPRGLSTAPIRKTSRVEEKFFPKHFDTENYFKNKDKIDVSDVVYITQKLHGTSIRIGHVPVSRKLSWIEKIAKKFGAKIDEFEYAYVYGSRNVTKDANNPDQQHFYASDLWTLEGNKLRGIIPKGFMIYGELIGWTPEKTPIQTGYTYNIPEGQRELYIYRVSYINPEGRETDLSWEQVKSFANSIGHKHVPEIITYIPGIGYGSLEHVVTHMLDKRLHGQWFAGIPVDQGKVDEGVCLRVDRGPKPLVLKAKSPLFLQHETKMLDKEVVDIEEEA